MIQNRSFRIASSVIDATLGWRLAVRTDQTIADHVADELRGISTVLLTNDTGRLRSPSRTFVSTELGHSTLTPI